jgi:RNA polymerase sigma factor (sigma-70 family)
MTEEPDHDLLAQYARTGSEAAFAVLVARYVNLVHSAAWRYTGHAQQAEEITQAVFIILARKASRLSDRTVLSGWLYQTARLTAANLVKGETRRRHREQEAHMNSIMNQPESEMWPQIAPLLDEAMGNLGETDRTVLVLRFFENKTNGEVAAALGLAEGTVQRRALRALDKLRTRLVKRGVSSTTAIIAGAISANSVQAAPVGLALKISAGAVAKGAAAGTSTLTLIKGALKLMAWAKAKTAIIVGAAILLTATTGTMVILAAKHDRPSSKLEVRTFAVDARVFSSHLRKATGSPADASIIDMATDYFASKGLNFGPPKSIFFKDPKSPFFANGLLYVKASPADLNSVEKIIQQLNYTPPQVHMRTVFIEVSESDAQAVLNAGTVLTTTNQNSVQILDDDITSQLLGWLSLHKAKTLGAPELTTTSGRAASLYSGDVNVDLISTINDDGFTVKTKIIARTMETLTAEANIWDGQTIALGSQKTDGKSRLFVFTATTMVDAAGNKIHSKADLPFRPGTIPPQ